jgi:UDP-N-acetyl-D-galactosamine dehydrogenase
MLHKGIQVVGSKVLILGITFKENCPDVRNTKVIDIIRVLQAYNINVCIYDPWANAQEVEHEYGVSCQTGEALNQKYDGIVVAVAHNEFKHIDYPSLLADNAVIYDTKCALSPEMVDARL